MALRAMAADLISFSKKAGSLEWASSLAPSQQLAAAIQRRQQALTLPTSQSR
jgi:hypothetical protein